MLKRSRVWLALTFSFLAGLGAAEIAAHFEQRASVAELPALVASSDVGGTGVVGAGEVSITAAHLSFDRHE